MKCLGREIDPVSKFVWVLNTSVVAFIMREPQQLFALTLVTYGTYFLLRDTGRKSILSFWKILALIPSCLFLFHLFAYEGKIVYQLGPLKITDIGVNAGAVYALRLFCSASAAIAFLLTTDLRELVSSLVRVRVPASFAFAVYLMLRFVPILTEEANSIWMALKSRVPRCNTLTLRLLLWRRYLFALVLLSIRRAEQTSLAMDVRGFAVDQPRTFLYSRTVGFYGFLFMIFELLASWAIALTNRAFYEQHF